MFKTSADDAARTGKVLGWRSFHPLRALSAALLRGAEIATLARTV
jgi:hypothetical protein